MACCEISSRCANAGIDPTTAIASSFLIGAASVSMLQGDVKHTSCKRSYTNRYETSGSEDNGRPHFLRVGNCRVNTGGRGEKIEVFTRSDSAMDLGQDQK